MHADAYLSAGGIEVMLLDGSVQVIEYNSVKALCFAADGAPADLFSAQSSFERRPKTPGLWTSFRLRDGDVLEGVLPHNILEWPEQGYFLTPPRANTPATGFSPPAGDPRDGFAWFSGQGKRL